MRAPGAFVKVVKGMVVRSQPRLRIAKLPLWCIRHPYFCEVLCYFGSDGGCPTQFESWKTFLEAHDDENRDMNLLVRFDWQEEVVRPGITSRERPCKSQLKLFYVRQRKGCLKAILVDVRRSDEPEVRRWLSERFGHLLGLWSPLVEEWKEGKKRVQNC